jgi:hypothetical protein
MGRGNQSKPFGIRWKQGKTTCSAGLHGWHGGRTEQEEQGQGLKAAGRSRTEQDGGTMNLWHANTRYFPVTSDRPRSENEPLYQGPRSSILAEIEKHNRTVGQCSKT